MKNAVSQSFSLPVDLVERLTHHMTTNNKSRSQIVQEALDEYLAKREKPIKCYMCHKDMDCYDCIFEPMEAEVKSNA